MEWKFNMHGSHPGPRLDAYSDTRPYLCHLYIGCIRLQQRPLSLKERHRESSVVLAVT